MLTCPLQIRPLARIVPTTSVSTFIKPSTSSHAAEAHMWRKKGDIRLNDLPTHIQSRFTTTFAPYLYEHFGTLAAWEQPTNADIQGLWTNVFPQERSLNPRTKEGTIVNKLVMCSSASDRCCTVC
jgi:hypothetical protein